MRRARYYTDAWDVVIVLIAVMLAAVALLWAVQAAGDEASAPQMDVIVTPWEGTFSAGEYFGDTPLVKVGDHVTPDTVVGMIYLDVMEPVRKVELFAGVKGTIVEVLVEDGSFVQAGEPLMVVKLDPPDTRVAN